MGRPSSAAFVILAAVAALARGGQPADNTVIRPGIPWFDTDGNRMCVSEQGVGAFGAVWLLLHNKRSMHPPPPRRSFVRRGGGFV
jgi:hypothetical protein